MSDTRSESHLQTMCLLTLTIVTVGAALFWLRPIVVPFVLAVFLALILDPVIGMLMRHFKMPRAVAMMVTLSIGFLLISLVGGQVAASVGQFASRSDAYQSQIIRLVEQLGDRMPLGFLGIDADAEFDPTTLFPQSMMESAIQILTSTTLGILQNGLIVMVFLVFLLIGGREPARPAGGIWPQVEHRVQRYIITKVVVSAATGLTVAIMLQFLGVRFAISFGAFTFFLNFIPNLGSIIATLLPLPVVLLSEDVTAIDVILVLALPGSVQFTVGNLIEPRVLGSRLDLHPVVVLLSLMFWGTIWGFEGLFLAVPMTASIKIAFERNETMAPVADLLAGRLSRFFGEA